MTSRPKIAYFKNGDNGSSTECDATDPEIAGTSFVIGTKGVSLLRDEGESHSDYLKQVELYHTGLVDAFNAGYEACGDDLRHAMGLS